ncbi:hypothetical protein PEC18_05410 [Paucibacter sp. O1-1]|nr:hypothetical protein [Paucibacter sp. O1-1]MDA3825307.1 hypothetical protein [Paucibacter sp. O1-1]
MPVRLREWRRSGRERIRALSPGAEQRLGRFALQGQKLGVRAGLGLGEGLLCRGQARELGTDAVERRMCRARASAGALAGSMATAASGIARSATAVATMAVSRIAGSRGAGSIVCNASLRGGRQTGGGCASKRRGRFGSLRGTGASAASSAA